MCFHNITGLSADKDYEFRVCAENFYGRSEPCEGTETIHTDVPDDIKKKKQVEGRLTAKQVKLNRIRYSFISQVVLSFPHHWPQSTPISLSVSPFLILARIAWQFYLLHIFQQVVSST